MYKNRFSYSRPLTTVLQVMEGDGTGTPPAAPQITPEIQALIAAQVEEATRGLKAKRDELLEDQRKLKDKLKPFEGLDPQKIADLNSRLDQDEDTKLFAEGKKELVIEKYTQRMREQHQRELEAERAKIQAEAQRANAFADQVLENQIRLACKGLHATAVEDALLAGKQVFKLDAKGKAVQLDSEGNPVRGKDGSTPFSPAEWIEQQKELKPHWFPSNTSGSGSQDNKPGNGGTGKTIKRSDFDALPGHKQAEIARSGTRIVD